jgi:hypothetical protein
VATPAAEEDTIHGQLPHGRPGVPDASSREAQPFRSEGSAQVRPPQQLAVRFKQAAFGATSPRLDSGRKRVEAPVQRFTTASTPSTRSSTFSSIPCRRVTSVRSGPKPSGGLVHRRQVMEVNDVTSARGTGDGQRPVDGLATCRVKSSSVASALLAPSS